MSAQILADYQVRVEHALSSVLPNKSQHPNRLHAAMEYAVMSSGKRIRPALVYAAGSALDVDLELLEAPACAVELVHAYSLVHDDLPAMDDDDLRRGKATCHKAFDEPTAILVGDALQSLAFQLLATAEGFSGEQKALMVDCLASGIGSFGMAGGQALDLEAEGVDLSLAQLEDLHQRKTGALIQSSVLMGAYSSGAKPASEVLLALEGFAKHLGLAFQIKDDILDVEGDSATIGKPQGSDEERNKNTYVRLLGLEQAKRSAERNHKLALECIDQLQGDTDMLHWLADYIICRDK